MNHKRVSGQESINLLSNLKSLLAWTEKNHYSLIRYTELIYKRINRIRILLIWYLPTVAHNKLHYEHSSSQYYICVQVHRNMLVIQTVNWLASSWHYNRLMVSGHTSIILFIYTHHFHFYIAYIKNNLQFIRFRLIS